MKLQSLAIIFVLIILPISLIIGEYANTQIKVLKLEQLYDAKLITATEDALKAFQLNTFSDMTSDIADRKISSIEASANAFYNSIETNFGLQGYTKEELQAYVPALVYTMYDGYYIYSPYANISNTTGDIDLTSDNIQYGFKPYVYYSCRYVRDDIDVIINYSLDNYITVQGMIGDTSVYESGYLLTLNKPYGLRKLFQWRNGTYIYIYNGQEINTEASLTENIVEKDSSGNITTGEYKYIKLNGTKYYLNEKDDDGDGIIDEYIFYLLGGNRIRQVAKNQNETIYNLYKEQIENNSSAINYYKNAYEFSKWVDDNLGDLEAGDAVDASDDVRNSVSVGEKIFENVNIEYSGSNFNLHRKQVIKYSIESNLSVAIANFNEYTNAGANFQMPKLKETEWEMLENEISIISFLQGLNIGGKIYNGYTVVNNSDTEEVIKEESIYITTKDGYYHKVNDKQFTQRGFDLNRVNSTGVWNLDFEIRKDTATGLSYVHRNELGCYTCIIEQKNVNNEFDSIYEYLVKNDDVPDKIKRIYYTALGRERWGTYKVENPSSIITILNDMND